MSTLARLEDEWHDEVPVARVQGEVDASNVNEIGDRLRALLTNRSVRDGRRPVGDDVPRQRRASTSSSRSPRRCAAASSASPSSSPTRSPIARMVALTGLDQAMPVHRTLPDALGELRDDPT